MDIRQILGLSGISNEQMPADPYGLNNVYRPVDEVLPPPVRIGPVSIPMYAAPSLLPPQGLGLARHGAGRMSAFSPPPVRADMPQGGMAGGSATVLPFRATTPVAQPQTPINNDSGTQRVSPLVGKDISIKTLTDLQRKAESTNNYAATNKTTSASGAYQYTDGTWNNYGGYSRALYAPPAVQDKRFAEDIAKRVAKYNGDVFKAVADHYLPAAANKPELWNQPFRMRSKGKTISVPPVANYIRHVLKGTQYEKQLDAYLQGH